MMQIQKICRNATPFLSIDLFFLWWYSEFSDQGRQTKFSYDFIMNRSKEQSAAYKGCCCERMIVG